jgi:hypothetical protein
VSRRQEEESETLSQSRFFALPLFSTI